MKKTRINIVEDVYSYVEKSSKDKYLKMSICDENKVIFNSITRKLKEIPTIDVLEVTHMSRKRIKEGTEDVDINYYYTEITNHNVDKWYALEELCRMKGINKEEIIAIGDNANDALMIKNAGFGIAMKNGTQDAKENAKLITESNNKNGVAVAIWKILENL